MSFFRKNSMYFSLFIGLLAFILPVNIILLGYTIYSGRVFKTHAVETYTDYANLVCKQIDQRLSDIQTYMNNIYYVDNRFSLMSRTTDNNLRYLYGQEISLNAADYLSLHTTPMIFFMHCQNLSIPAASTFTSLSDTDSIAMSNYIHTFAEDYDYPDRQFFLTQLNEKYYLSEYYHRNGIVLGMIIDIESLLTTLDFKDSNIASTFFCDSEGMILTYSETDTDYASLQINVPLSNAPMSLVMQIPEYRILGKLSSLLLLTIMMLVLSIAGVAAYIIFIQKKIQHPLNRLKDTILQIQSGAIESKVDTTDTAMEIADVYNTFNNFMDNITNLKLVAYEEKLSRQQTEMQYLRLQLRPHFFLNSLKSIFALAQRQEIKQIQDYVLCLSTHYRFLIYDTTNLIPLKDELLHTQNYIQLQRIGYNLPIECDVHINFPIDTVQVPTLIIQTFVENSIKYATVPGKTLHLDINIELLNSEDLPILNFTIKDNGPGFAAEIMEEIKNNEEEFFQKHKGFGNLKRRLSIMYSEEAPIYFYNLPNDGAAAEILLPYMAHIDNERSLP